jgi:hypothetical protein
MEGTAVIWRELWGLLASVVTVVVVGLATVIVCDRRVFPPSVEYRTSKLDQSIAAENEGLRRDLREAQAELLAERARHLATRADLDSVRRGAVWVPPKPDLDAADLIPPQNLPVPVIPAGK